MKRNSVDKVLTLINVKICRAEQLTRNEIFDVIKKHIELCKKERQLPYNLSKDEAQVIDNMRSAQAFTVIRYYLAMQKWAYTFF